MPAFRRQDRCLEFLISRRQELFNGLPILDSFNSPYRNTRLSEGSSAALDDDDDDDIPFRRSQESVKLASSAGSPTRPSLLGPTGSGLHLDTKAVSFPPRSSSFQGPSSGEPTPVVHNGPPLPDVSSDAGSQLEYLSAPMSKSQSRSSNFSNATSDSDTYRGSPQAPGTAEVPSSYTSHNFTGTMAADALPKRTLSQRAKVGSASIAAAVKNLARSRSGSNSHSSNSSSYHGSHPPTPLHSSTIPPTASLTPPLSWQHPPGATSPLRETYSPEIRSATSSSDSNPTVPPLLPSRPIKDPIRSRSSSNTTPSQQGLQSSGDNLPAGAAPLMGRPPSLIASSPPSALPTPDQGLHRTMDNPLFAEPHSIQNLALVDPDSVFETYHQAEDGREGQSTKKRAATD